MSRLLIALALALLASPALAWNARGHRAVAALAEANLTPAAQAQVRELLAIDLDRANRPSGRRTLAAVASWPDEIRAEGIRNGRDGYRGWHVRANPVCSAALGPCKEGHCVDNLIVRYTAVLRDRAQPAYTRNEALKWVVHLVGDLHQPLHSGVNPNSGRARVILQGPGGGKPTTFHDAWDGALLNATLHGWQSQARLASTTPLAPDAPTQWMRETREVALRAAYQPLPGFVCNIRLPEPFALDAAYQQHSVAVVRQQIERAGLRLAQLLNETLADR